MKRIKKLERLGIWYSVITLTADDQSRGLEVFHRVGRRPLLVQRRIPRLPLEIPFRKPQLFGSAVERPGVVQSHHRSNSLEAIRVALEPHHHVSAVRPTHRAHSIAINVRQFLDRVCHLHEILKNHSGPVAGYLRGEVLPVPRRTVRVGERHNVPCSGIDLPITTERIGPL